LKSLHACALLTFGNGTNILFLTSPGMYPDLQILLLKFAIISVPFCPMNCRSFAESVTAVRLLFWQILDQCFDLFAADNIYIYIYHSPNHRYQLLLCFHLCSILSYTQPIFLLLRLFPVTSSSVYC